MNKRTFTTRQILNELKKIKRIDYIETPKLSFDKSKYIYNPNETLSFDVFTDNGIYAFYYTEIDYDVGIITVSIYGDLNTVITVESKELTQGKALRNFLSKYEIKVADVQ